MPKGPATHPPTTAESRRALGKHWWMGATGERCFFSWQHGEEEETFGFWHEPDVAKTTKTKRKRYWDLPFIQKGLRYRADSWSPQNIDTSLLHQTVHIYIRLLGSRVFLPMSRMPPNFFSLLPRTGPCKQGSAKGHLTQEKRYVVAGDCALPLDIWVHQAAHTPTAAAFCGLSSSLWALVPKIWSVAQVWLTACRWMKDRYQVCLNPRMWHSQRANLKRPFILEYHMCLFWLFFFNLDLLYG